MCLGSCEFRCILDQVNHHTFDKNGISGRGYVRARDPRQYLLRETLRSDLIACAAVPQSSSCRNFAK
jgi:hypothetical protein